MENIEEIFHEYIRIKLSTSKEAYINELINNKNYLSHPFEPDGRINNR